MRFQKGSSHSPAIIFSNGPLLGSYLRMLLGHLGLICVYVEKLDEVRSRLEQSPPDLLFFDSSLSRSDWLELEKAMDGLKSQPAIILLGMSKGADFILETTDKIGISHILDPFNPNEVAEKTQKVLKRTGHRAGSESEWKLQDLDGLQLSPGALVGISKEIRQIKNIADRVAETDVTVLVRGESGTGKELVAGRIHYHSKRKDKAFVKVLCPAIPDNLLESELFGYEKGSFTGAFTRKPGRFEFANEGTIFLDEIGDIPLSLQSKLLQVLQEGEFARIGGSSDIRVNVRIVAATNKDLEKEVRDGAFREDLFYRLNVVNIYMPPLRDRKEDVPILVHHFLERNNRQFNKKVRLSEDTIKLFMEYHWPGNVRELKHTLERIVVLGNEGDVVGQLIPKIGMRGTGQLGSGADPRRSVAPETGSANTLPDSVASGKYPGVPFEDRRRQDRRKAVSSNELRKFEGSSLKTVSRNAARLVEEEMIKKVLEQTRWNRREAAKVLGISYKALLYKIKRFDQGSSH
jgi:DNA-binding NtrC family response regulator